MISLTKKLLIFQFLLLFFSCKDDSGEKQKLFEQIKVGMTQKEVINILGKPGYIDSSDHKIRYYYHSDDDLHSSAPSVYFDSTGKVTFATYGEGG